MRVPLKVSGCVLDMHEHELKSKTNEIKQHFAHFIINLQQHMLDLQRDEKLDVSVIKSHIIMYDKKLKAPVSCCKTLEDIFNTLCLPKYSSFLNYELLKLFIDYGNDEIKCQFIKYKQDLQEYLKNRIIKSLSAGKVLHAVLVDESMIDENTDLIQLQNRVNILLGHKNLTLLHYESLNRVQGICSVGEANAQRFSSPLPNLPFIDDSDSENSISGNSDNKHSETNSEKDIEKSKEESAGKGSNINTVEETLEEVDLASTAVSTFLPQKNSLIMTTRDDTKAENVKSLPDHHVSASGQHNKKALL